MDFGEPAPDVLARLYNEIKEKKVLELDWKSPGKKSQSKKRKVEKTISPVQSDEASSSKADNQKYDPSLPSRLRLIFSCTD